MLKIFENNLPRRIRFGRGISLELGEELRRMGKSRPFIVTDQGVNGAGLLARVAGALSRAGMDAGVYDRTEAEPPSRASRPPTRRPARRPAWTSSWRSAAEA